MTIVIDTRVSPQMKKYLLANRLGKLHADQRREVVTEPVVTVLLLMVPAIILLRRFLVNLFVGNFWMIGVGIIIYGAVTLFLRSRRYSRIQVYYAIFRSLEKPPPRWQFWKPIVLMTLDGKPVLFKHSLLPDRHLQADQEYLVYYLKSSKGNTLLSFAPTDHFESGAWKPVDKLQKTLQ